MKAKIIEGLEKCPLWLLSFMAGLGTWFTSLFLYAPPLWLPFFGGANLRLRADDYLVQCANPLAQQGVDPILRYRITSPTIAWVLGLRGFPAFFIQYAALPLFLAVVFYAVAKRTDKQLALLLALVSSLTYTCIWPDTNPGYPDSVTHLAVAFGLLSPNPVLAAIVTIFGTLNDERMILAFPFLVLWHYQFKTIGELFVRSWKLVLGLISGLMIVMLVRHALTVGWIGKGFSPPNQYIQVYNSLRYCTPLIGWMPFWADIWFSFRYFWFIAIFYLASNEREISLLQKIIFATSFLLNFASMLTIADIARGVCYAYPAILVAATALYQSEAAKLKKLCNICIFLAVITPNFYMMSNYDLFWNRPLPIALIQKWDNIDLLSPAVRKKYPLLNHIQP